MKLEKSSMLTIQRQLHQKRARTYCRDDFNTLKSSRRNKQEHAQLAKLALKVEFVNL